MTEGQPKCRLGVLVVTPTAWKLDKARCQGIIKEMSPAPGEDEVKPLQDQGHSGYGSAFQFKGIHPSFEEVEMDWDDRLKRYCVIFDEEGNASVGRL